jgi:geranylgeranyl transferase type-2 subunit alpha
LVNEIQGKVRLCLATRLRARRLNINAGKVETAEFTPELLQKTAELLKKNPEYYTIWNHRRRIYANEFRSLGDSVSINELSEESRQSQVLDIIQLDLQFLFPLLLKFPKCYWIWNHRLWLLDQSTQLLPTAKSLPLWEHELGLVGQMLTRDNRNFHGWSYRRTVIDNLERLNESSLAQKELGYTTKMISSNLSNFSAWHNRSKLILRTLEEQQATDEERQKMLDDGK